VVTLCALPFAVGTPWINVRESRPPLSQLFWPFLIVESLAVWLYVRWRRRPTPQS
jgi:hypothetical protein